MDSEQELVFAKVLIQRGLAASEAVKECLRVQSLRAAQGRRSGLAPLFVERGLLSEEALESARRTFEAELKRCEGCGAYVHPLLQPDASPTRCRKCSAASRRAAEPKAPEPPREGVHEAGTPEASRPVHASREFRERIGEYDILEVVAKGGMGVVFKAYHRTLHRVVALKVLREARRNSEENVKRFKREAQSIAKLQHDNIVRVHEFGFENGEYFFTMDFIEGESFEKFLARPDRDIRRGVELIRDAARALEFAHRNGIVHRDVKPANILLDAEGRPHVTDFGLARNVDHATALTQEGELLGTPLYMSPEQVRGRVREVDARSDVYGLGVLLYQHLAGRLPFLAQTMVELQWKVVNEDPTPLRQLNPAIDVALETVTGKCLEKAREDRYQTAGELARDLDHWLEGRRIVAQRLSQAGRFIRRVRRSRAAAAGIVAAALFLVLVGALVALVASRDRATAHERAVRKLEETLAAKAKAAELAIDAARSDLDGNFAAVEGDLATATAILAEADAIAPADLDGSIVDECRRRSDLLAQRRALLELSARAEARRGTREGLAAAGAHLEELLRIAPDDTEVLLDLGSIRRDARDLDGADRAASRALSLSPNLPRALKLKAEVAIARRRFAEADALLCTALAAEHAQGRCDTKVLTLRAVARIELGKERDALPDLEEVIAKEPLGAQAYMYRGEAYSRLDDPARASRDFDRAIELAPESSIGYLYRGRFSLREGDPQRAADDLRFAIEQDDGLVEAVLLHGIALYELLDEERAEAELAKAARLGVGVSGYEPTEIRARAYAALGRLYRAEGLPVSATAAYRDAIRDEASAARRDACEIELGRSLIDAGETEQALARLEAQEPLIRREKASDGSPASALPRAALDVARGLAALARDLPEKARSAFDEAVEIAPRDVEALAGRGEALFRLGSPDAALLDLRAALRAPGCAEDVRILFREGKKAEALARHASRERGRAEYAARGRKYFAWAARLCPSLARAHVERARMLADEGLAEDALLACRAAIAANRAATDAFVLRGRLEVASMRSRAAVEDFSAAMKLGAHDYRIKLAYGSSLLDVAEALAADAGAPGTDEDRVPPAGSRADLIREAAQDLEAIAKVAPGDAAVQEQLARVRAALGDAAGAAAARARIADLRDEQRGGRVTALVREAARLEAENDLGAAADRYRRAIELSPEQGSLFLALSGAERFDPQLSARDLARAIELEPVLAGSLYSRLYQITQVVNWNLAFDLAAPDAVTSTADAQSEASRAFLRGFLHVLRVESGRGLPDDCDRGREELTAALDGNPASASAYFLRGLLALRASDLRSAKEDLTLALVLEPSSQVAFVWLAGVYAEENRSQLAFTYLRRAIEHGFRDWGALRRDAALDRLRLDPQWEEIMKD